MVNASAGVCPDYTQTNLSGPCGTNGYCNNGACVSCPASTESCSIDADEYDPATQCLMTKMVVCGENEVCEGDICVCAEGYELYELFEKICQENHISLSKEAAVSLKTFLLIYYRLHKTTSNIYFVRDIYEKINLNRCLRTQQTQISLEDVLKVIGG